MKLKYYDILNSRDILNKLIERKDFDGNTSLKLARNAKKIEPELVLFEAKKQELIKKYSKKIGNEWGIEKGSPEMNAYTKEMSEMVQQEIEVDILLIDSGKIFGVTPFELFPIEWMFEV